MSFADHLRQKADELEQDVLPTMPAAADIAYTDGTKDSLPFADLLRADIAEHRALADLLDSMPGLLGDWTDLPDDEEEDTP